MNTIESRAIQPNVYYTLEETADLLRVSRQAVSELLISFLFTALLAAP